MKTYDFAAALHRTGGLWQAEPLSKFDPSKPHAELTSGRHSDGFVNLSMLLTDPAELSRACGHLVRKAIADFGTSPANPLTADWVIGSATGGITICHEIGKWLDVRAAFTEKTDDGKSMQLSRFVIPRGSTVLVVEDVMTTGGTCIKTADEMRRWDCKIIPLILTTTNRRNVVTLSGAGEVFCISSLDLDVVFSDWPADNCPYCQIGSKPIRPKENNNWSFFMPT